VQAKQGTLKITITIPSAASARTTALKRIYSAASETAGILFTVYPHNGNPATQAVSVNGNDISSTSPLCVASGTGRSCTISIAAPAVSTNDLLAQTYDQIIPANGTVPSGAHLLAAATITSVAVTAGTINTVAMTLNPVLNTVSIVTTPAALHAMLPGTFSVSVYGYDTTGNLILAGTYVNGNGNPVTLTLSMPSNPNNAFALSGTTVTGSGTFVTGTYAGMADTTTAFQITTAAPYPATGSVALLAPSVNAVPDANLSGTPPAGVFGGIADFSGGSEYWVFYTTPAAAVQGVSYVNAGSNSGPGTQIPASQTPNPLPTTLPVQGGLAFGTNFLYSGGSQTTQFPYTNGSPPPLPVPQVAATCNPITTGACSTTSGIAYDGGSTLYYGSGNYVTSYTLGSSAIQTSVFNVTTPTTTPVFAGFAYDSAHGILWFADNQPGGSVYDYDGTSFYQSPGLATAPWAVALDASGNAYFTQPSAHHIVKYAAPATASYTQIITTVEAPEYIAYSPNSNTLWFSESVLAGGVILGRLDLTTGAISEMTIAASGSAGPITVLPYAEVVAVVQYSGTASPGNLLLVQP